MPPALGENLHSALNERKVDHERMDHISEGHGFYDVGHRVDMYEKILVFLDRSIGSNQKFVPSK